MTKFSGSVLNANCLNSKNVQMYSTPIQSRKRPADTLTDPMARYGKRPRRTRRKSNRRRRRKNVAKIARGVYRRMAEWKKHTRALSVTESVTGTVYDLSAVPQGDTDLTRDGDQLYMGSMSFMYQWYQADDANTCRTIIFQWFPATTPTAGDIITSGLGGSAPNYLYETDKAWQYKILYDKTVTINRLVSTSPATAAYTRVIKRRIRPSRKKIQFTGGTTTGTNKIYLLVITDSGVTTHPHIEFISRLNYCDP